ncbi:MAG: ATP-grasp domain-containing protein [Oligoflexia bacterium]|nr:ATP-grasp domain-containing protein [Oligoflexia bacterium]
MAKLSKVLILNRGEIACRLIQACQELGLKTVALYSDQDKNARHTELADESIALEGTSALETYLNLSKIIPLAKKIGCDAVHPGYGFLSERAEAAEIFAKEKIKWIGPSANSIRMLGDKLEAKKLLDKYKIPTAPWAEVALNKKEELTKSAKAIGYPILVKAASGGGGKGMRLIQSEDDLLDSVAAVAREAKASFGDGTLLLEKFIDKPRHIEIQIFGDEKGNVTHFGDRECSMQRRHQKVIEEAPAPRLSEKTKQKMADAAVSLGKGIGYASAGTVEFLVDENENFYFLEVNSRLQVEHSVTESVWGIDLVKSQILVAEGKLLKEIFPDLEHKSVRGHAIQARIYAENPEMSYAPSPGLLSYVEFPYGVGVRVDTGIKTGSEIGTNFDAMIAKITASDSDRDSATQKLLWALRNTIVFGCITNINFLQDIISTKEFSESKVDVKFLERNFNKWKNEIPEGALKILEKTNSASTQIQQSNSSAFASPWDSIL